ncbi:MAG: STAS/SEC14 domain-containing protein [Candidatus Zixiibacteriota bacterium]
MKEKDKEISYEVIKNDNFLHLRYSGVWSGDTAETVIDKMIELMAEYRQDRVLIDVRGAKYQSSMFSEYIISQKIQTTPLVKAKKIAYVDLISRKESADNISQMIRVFRLPIRFFFSEEDALAWLLEDINQS